MDPLDTEFLILGARTDHDTGMVLILITTRSYGRQVLMLL